MPLTFEDIRPSSFQDKHLIPELFVGISEGSMQKILNHSILRRYPAGYLLLQQGDSPTHLYLLMRGNIKTLRTDSEGKEAVIRMLKPGEICMEAVIFMNAPSPVAVQVMDEAQLLLVPEKIVRTLALEDTKFANNILKILASHYKNAMHQIDAISTKTPQQRIGYYLLLKYLEEGDEKTTFKLPFKKSIIANHLGMTPETFSRTLKQIREMGINIDGEDVSLQDAYILCIFCDTDTAALCSSYDPKTCPPCSKKHC